MEAGRIESSRKPMAASATASIGPVKRALRAVDLGEVRMIIDAAATKGLPSARPALRAFRDTRRLPI
ncbi:MAG: hypothetical protein AAFQ88_11920, partial [Pseudomonadota bacterium]